MRRIFKEEKQPASSIKLKEERKKVSDSIAEDKKVQENLVKQLKDLNSEIKVVAELRDKVKKETDIVAIDIENKYKEIKDIET